MTSINQDTEMTLEEARRILADQDHSDPERALEAVVIVLRFNGISDPRLIPIAEEVEAAIRCGQQS